MFLKIKLLLVFVLAFVDGFVEGIQSKTRRQTFYAAKHRALQTFTQPKKARSAVLCVSYCHSDQTCQSVNYQETAQLCWMNNITRKWRPDDFITQYGNVYFDADEDTPLSAHQPSDCMQLLKAGYMDSGIYTIPTGFSTKGLKVYCNMDTSAGGGGWIVIQRRQDGSVDFDRNWIDYSDGFGNLAGEFWLGNDILRVLTESTVQPWKLRVDLEDWENNTAWAEYEEFGVHGDNFTLQITAYNTNSTAGDSLSSHNGLMFTTKDRETMT